MPSLSLTNAACQYIVNCFEAALLPAPKEPPKDYDLKHYVGGDVRSCNDVLLPFDVTISGYLNDYDAIVREWQKKYVADITPGMGDEQRKTLNEKYGMLIQQDQEKLTADDGQKAVLVSLDESQIRWLKREWPSVDRPTNRKQRPLSDQVSKAIDAASTATKKE